MIPNDDGGHPFIYDIELILGGKLHEVERSLLLYTTASQEGMTGESRARRKRKPNATEDTAAANDNDNNNNNEATITITSTTKKEKPKTKKQPAKKQKKAPAAKTTKKRSAKPTSEKKGSTKKAKPSPADEPPSTAMGMYERHRREFERSSTRLEKADAYNFFGTDVPKEFDECYSKPTETETETDPALDTPTPTPSTSQTHAAEHNANDSASTPQQAQHEDIMSNSQSPSSNNDKKTPKKKNDDDTIQFPSHPPYNLEIVRKRMEHGRYVLERDIFESEERLQLMTPYFKSIGKKIPRRCSKKKQRYNLPVVNPKGVNWDLFRQDIIGMCDAAVARNPVLDSGLAGSLSHAAAKIKDVMEQIYERTGCRHNGEMATANDRYRFSLAMDSTHNFEAALQGKWRKDGTSTAATVVAQKGYYLSHPNMSSRL
jgi:hypothetical protein